MFPDSAELAQSGGGRGGRERRLLFRICRRLILPTRSGPDTAMKRIFLLGLVCFNKAVGANLQLQQLLFPVPNVLRLHLQP